MMPGWTTAPSNNNTCCGGLSGGIPSPEPVMHIPVDERRYGSELQWQPIMAQTVLAGDLYYYLGDVATVALDLKARNELWRAPAIHRAIDGVALWEDFVFSGWFVHNRHTGEKIADLRELTGFDDPGRRHYAQVTPDGFLRYIEAEKMDLSLYNPKTGDWRYMDLPLVLPVYLETERLLLGLKDHELVAADYPSGEERWRKQMPVDERGEMLSWVFGYGGREGKVFVHLYEDVFECCDSRTGSTLWRTDRKLQEKSRYGAAVDVGSIEKDVYAQHSGSTGISENRSWLLAVDFDTGERKLERYYDDRFTAMALNGDVLFGVFDTSRLVALDRFTGDILWEASEFMEAAYHCVTAGNRVVFNSTVNEIRVYEWDEPYISPHRW